MGRGRTRITIDYTRCGDGRGVDPRECCQCLRVCEPAVFLLHESLGATEPNPYDPEIWRVTPLWPSLCTRCGACMKVCPVGAVKVRPAPVAGAGRTSGAGHEAGAASPRDFERCTVIGGAGMLGHEIVRQLVAAGKQVRVLDLEPQPEPCGEAFLGDVRSKADVRAACDGAEVVFQCAAAVWDVRTPASLYNSVNVWGNQRVITMCRELGIQRLVYTSTIDVVVQGRRPVRDGDESLPYPRRLPRDPYSRSKILAEQLVLAANSSELATCALRPVGMYGPRDRYHLGNVLEMARRGNKIRLGSGKARFSHAYSENVAHAHVLAAEHLFPGSRIAGQAYFIGDHYPAENFFDFMEPFLRELGLPVPKRSISYPLAYALAWVAELVAPHSNFNRFSVIQTCVDHTFRYDRASRDFGYQPLISREEAFRRTLAYFQGMAASCGPS